MFKRARTQCRAPTDDVTTEDPVVTQSKEYWGSELRKFLLDRYCLEGLTGADVAAICWFVTQCGGLGVNDLALHPDLSAKHGNEHVKLHAGKIWPDLELEYVDCPVYSKRESRRDNIDVPVYLPSTAFKHYITEEMMDFSSETNQLAFETAVRGLDNYSSHPVVCKAKADGFGNVVRPIALYWDGVAYTKHDSFMGFYVTDILTSQKFLSFLIRISDANDWQSLKLLNVRM